ncbi:FAD-dependent oxidoreductase [Acidisoma sp. 7E03]
MTTTYTQPRFTYRQSAEQRDRTIRRVPLVIVGAGPVGLTAALDCARQDLPALLLDDNDTVSVGSRAVCYAKRSLEVWDRLGCGDRLVAKGVEWKVGKVFFKDKLAYQFDLLPDSGHKMPAMINLQQYYLEHYLVDALADSDCVDLRWKHRVTALHQHDGYVSLTVETPDGAFTLEADWVIACDGANSSIRSMVGARFAGEVFHDRFLIADIVMEAAFPPERWFWFDPPFHPHQSVLLHRQPDNLWRIDFQLGPDADAEAEKKPDRIIPRVRAMLGDERPFTLEWASVYQFACRRIDQFRHGRVIFAGDSAHQVSPFGARGANSGMQDADNLVWKLKLVVQGDAPEALLDTYHEERAFAADDNIRNSTQATDFISPKTPASRLFRDATLELAHTAPFARRLVNSGRLSMPTPYDDSSLTTSDRDIFAGGVKPGTNCPDAPITIAGEAGWLLSTLGGGFRVLTFGRQPTVSAVSVGRVTASIITVGKDIADSEGLLTTRYDGEPGTTYLIRPDQYVAARWRCFDCSLIEAALARAIAVDREQEE